MVKQFDKANLSQEAQKVYDDIISEQMHLGEPLDLVHKMFESFERSELRGPP
jgi:hypothetical protein